MCSCDQSLVTLAFLWEKFSQLQFYKDLKNLFFEGWSWFKFNNLGLALGTNLKIHTSVAKGLNLKVRKFLGLTPTFVEVRGEKLVGRAFLAPWPPSWIGLIQRKLISNILRQFCSIKIVRSRRTRFVFCYFRQPCLIQVFHKCYMQSLRCILLKRWAWNFW